MYPSAAENASQLEEDFPTQNNTSGGSRDTEVKEFAVIPRSSPVASLVVMIVTPVRKEPRTLLNVALSISVLTGRRILSAACQ
ncbi:hypothetical protein GCM10027079_17690 [Sediminivirga luteola]|uniref:Uncharacterized protein n=1 Tax=Sediminivirga luteola TaxID=1774748 RepID=A0A8J2TVR5_9MICO|nr:hypothetical protein GCM10011333_05160 [Sediminivirga luteola]